MTKVMLGSVYDAFRAANVPDDKARAASEDIAGYDTELKEMRRAIDAIRAEVSLVKWMVGAMLAMVIAIAVRLFVGV
ncbi:MAG: integrase [Pseudomonadota bacterium]